MTGPGLAKARRPPLVVVRRSVVERAVDPVWRDLFACADSMSEGAVREEAQGRMWYGSTSLILAAADADHVRLAAVASRDVHVRLRALRAARREACVRAPARLGCLACEIRFADVVGGVRIDVDVQAPLIERSVHSRAR